MLHLDLIDIPQLKDLRKHHASKLSHDQVIEIRNKLASGVMAKSLAIDYDVHLSTICNIKNNKNYRKVRDYGSI
jgi:hypothetical protein